MSDILGKIDAPWLLWILAGSTVAYTVLRQLAESSEFVSQLLGPVGRKWAQSRSSRKDHASLLLEVAARLDDQAVELDRLRDHQVSDEWNRDLKRQVESLSNAVAGLRRRNQIVDAYLLYDEEWHRRELLVTAGSDNPLTPHISFLEFEENWRGEGKYDEV